MSSPAGFGKDTPASDVCKYFAPEIEGTTTLITGPTIGSLGFETARAIAEQGAAKLLLIGRDGTKWVAPHTHLLLLLINGRTWLMIDSTKRVTPSLTASPK